MSRIAFVAKPSYPMADQGEWTFVMLPSTVHKRLGGDRARIPIVVHLGKTLFRTSAMPYDGQHLFMFNVKMREASGKQAGDSFRIEIERDFKKRTVAVPADLKRALKPGGLLEVFEKMSTSHRKEHVEAITGAKKPETRTRRIARCVAMMKTRGALT